MAESEEKPTTEQAAEGAATSGNKSRLIFIALVSVGLTIGAGTGAMLVGPMLANKLGKTTPVADSTASDSTTTDTLGSAQAMHVISDLVLNPASSGGSRFLLVSIAMECANANVVSTLVRRDAELRDVVLSTLGRKTIDELTDVNTRDVIKTELLTVIHERFGKKSVQRLYFPQFVVQ